MINASLGRNYCYAQGGFASRSEAELGLNHSTPKIFVIHLVGTFGDVEEPWSDGDVVSYLELVEELKRERIIYAAPSADQGDDADDKGLPVASYGEAVGACCLRCRWLLPSWGPCSRSGPWC